MEIKLHEEGEKLTVELLGRLDTLTAPELSQALESKNSVEMIIDLSQLDYISSAGLRVLLTAQKKVDEREGSLVIKNPNPVVRNIFKITGFDRNIHIE